jgi:diadenosine tetraphosphatase ApaH/serine/threonine PP2A family protein phosphatase
VVSAGADTLFCGHTHVPYVRTLSDNQLLVKVEQVGAADHHYQFTPPIRRIVNAGSVGEPRHGRPNATYVLYDTDDQVVNIREVEYDYQKTCAAIIDVGLPPIFAWRLAQGLEFAERADDPSHICER